MSIEAEHAFQKEARPTVCYRCGVLRSNELDAQLDQGWSPKAS